MKSICYIVPYFGKIPKEFQIWLDTCKFNETINWIIITNDMSEFDYPNNVQRIQMSFEEVKQRIQQYFDFTIQLENYWEISFFKPAYGEIFQEYIQKYDFWGHCDIDLMWGNIRKFITDDILEKYEKIGFQGHSTLYKNTKEINRRYKTIVPGQISYKDVYSGKVKYSFDENGMEKIYNFLNIDYYKETNFAHLSKYDYSFYLKYLPDRDSYKNERQIFIWKNGKLERLYLDNGKIGNEEFMYIHFFCRPIKYKVEKLEKNKKYIIYPDVIKEYDKEIDYNFIKKFGKCSKMQYYIRSLYYNRKKITIKKIRQNIKRMIEYKKTKRG